MTEQHPSSNDSSGEEYDQILASEEELKELTQQTVEVSRAFVAYYASIEHGVQTGDWEVCRDALYALGVLYRTNIAERMWNQYTIYQGPDAEYEVAGSSGQCGPTNISFAVWMTWRSDGTAYRRLSDIYYEEGKLVHGNEIYDHHAWVVIVPDPIRAPLIALEVDLAPDQFPSIDEPVIALLRQDDGGASGYCYEPRFVSLYQEYDIAPMNGRLYNLIGQWPRTLVTAAYPAYVIGQNSITIREMHDLPLPYDSHWEGTLKAVRSATKRASAAGEELYDDSGDLRISSQDRELLESYPELRIVLDFMENIRIPEPGSQT